MTDKIVEAEVVTPDPEPGVELAAPATSVPSTLFRTDDPVEVLERATAVANALAPAIEERGLYATIHGKKHILVEGWTTLGAMLGVTPVCEWTRPVDGGWEARVEARTLDGRVIGAAEAQCLKEEGGPWAGADYARRSMAQTRATSKALGSVLRFVVTLAGYSGTPAEEMTNTEPPAGRKSDAAPAYPASKKQREWVVGGGNRPSLFDQAALDPADRFALVRYVSGSSDELTKTGATRLIEAMKDDPQVGAKKLLAEIREKAAAGDENAKAALAGPPSDVPGDTEGLPTGDADEEPPFNPAEAKRRR